MKKENFLKIFIQIYLILFIFINSVKPQNISNTDEITSLPGLNFKPNFKQYSGYLKASDNDFLFYWLVTSQNNNPKGPLIIWFNAPGAEFSQRCSPLSILFSKMGPYSINSNGTLDKNEYSWNKRASLLFIETPKGNGFSFAKNNNYRTGDNQTADENYVALKQFFNKYPNYKKNELYFAGMSYAGYTAPLLARRVLDGNKNFRLNLKGILLDNPILNVYLNKNMAAQFAYSRGFVDEHLWNDFKANCCKGCVDPSNCDINFLSGECRYKTVGIVDVLLSRRVYPFDIYRDCPIPQENLQPGEPCLYISGAGFIYNYLNQEQVQKALHIQLMNNEWRICSAIGRYLYHTEYDDISPILKGLLKEKIRIIIFNGDTDALNIYLTAQKIVENLGQKLTTSKQPWLVNGQIGGFKTEYGKLLTFTTVRGQGQLIHLYAPEIAEYILNKFLNNLPL